MGHNSRLHRKINEIESPKRFVRRTPLPENPPNVPLRIPDPPIFLNRFTVAVRDFDPEMTIKQDNKT